MRKIVGIVVAFLLLFSLSISPNVVYAASLSDSIIMQLTETHSDSQIDINVKLITNTGISAMTLELVYNKNVFEYDSYDRGPALENLDLISTDLSSDPTLPVKFNWLNQNVENDFSTGILLQLHFNLKPNISSGEYNIGFRYNNGDIVYIQNGNPNYKSAIISKAVVSVDENRITKTEIVEEEKENHNLILILGIVMISLVSITVIATIVIKETIKRKRKSENWIKI